MNEQDGVVNYLDWAVRGKTGVGRYVAVAVLALVTMFGLTGFLSLPLKALASDKAMEVPVANFGFALTLIAIPVLVRLLLGRPWWSVAVPRFPGPAKDLLVGFAIMVGLLVVKNLVMQPLVPVMANAFDRWADPAVILPYLAVAVPSFLIQVSAEEVLYRGLLAQFVRRFTQSPWLIVGITAILFALPHFANLANAGGSPVALVPYVANGLLFGYAAWRSGSLWLPIGIHFGNNLFLVTMVGMESDAAGTGNILFLIAPSIELIAAMAVGLSLAAAIVIHLLYRHRPIR
jgi:hypothetical protein